MDEDGNSYALRKHLEREEQQDAIAEMMQLGADEKPMGDQAYALCEEGILYGAVIELAGNDRFRGYLLTDTGKAAEILEDVFIRRANAFDEVAK